MQKTLQKSKDKEHKEPKRLYNEQEKQRQQTVARRLAEEETRAKEVFQVFDKKPKLDLNANLAQSTLEKITTDWNKDGPKTKRTDQLVVEMIARDIRPFTVVENDGFVRLMKFIAPKYQLKSRYHYFETLLPELFGRMFHRVKKELDEIEFLSFTCDAWTSKSNEHSLLSLTAHYLDSNFNPR